MAPGDNMRTAKR